MSDLSRVDRLHSPARWRLTQKYLVDLLDDKPAFPFELFFFSREEARMHVHVQSAEAEAKFWMEPDIELDENFGFPERELGRILKLLRDRESEIRQAWHEHFSR